MEDLISTQLLSKSMPVQTAETVFIEHSRQLLICDYLPKLERCVQALPEEALWWRPNANSNAIGNLLLHLAGNVRQWIIHGVGGAPNVRSRQDEFDADGSPGKETLLSQLRLACEEAAGVLSALEPARLTDRCTIQGIEVTVLGAIYHALEHFSGHLGQIFYITKLRTGDDLGFWVIGEGGNVERGWTVP